MGLGGGMASSEGRRILVAVDEGDESVHALRWCLSTFAAAARGDTVILLYVRPAPPTYSVLDASGYLFAEEVSAAIDRYSREVADAVVEKAQKLCTLYNKEMGENNDHEMKVEVKVAVGDARSIICQMADKLGADILVMGSHGYGFFKRALLGSVSDYCLRNSTCPVLIVKSQHE
ncbi:universal stress protein A-like protein isoform X2 [Phragmites australis]|uniref:universal stress protein A-like protein isoform X2 n=1 Tax=Phragmites australis TaxID=29695 RepID=UPI002D7652A1|nr:universal stress protein A-like protein isoform X2 [Phragmites australis]